MKATDNSAKKATQKFGTAQITLLGLMVAVLILMACTPLGYLNIGTLAITFNVVPVAISAIALGPFGGAVAGFVFGLTSFLQCLGFFGGSAFGAQLFAINPVFAFLLCFVPRIADGYLLGHIFRRVRAKSRNTWLSCTVTGFFSAFLNTLFFMTLLVILYGNSEYIRGMMGGMNVVAFICALSGINAVFEMLASTILTGAVGAALSRARLIPDPRLAADGGSATLG